MNRLEESVPGNSRRTFVRNSGAAVLAAGTAALTPPAFAHGGKSPRSTAEPRQSDGKKSRQVIPGSPSPNFSRAVRLDRIVFVSGVLPVKPGTHDVVSGDFEPQCRQALESLMASVKAAGSAPDQVLKCNVYLTDAADFPAMNKVYVEFFPKDPPARSTVVVKQLVAPGAKIEIDCVTSVE